MLAVLLILFNTITVNETVIAPEVIKVIEQRTEEWVAPGYSIAEEIVINPLDYGDAQEDMNGVPRITSFQSFFLDTPEGEKWLVILSFDKKIVVLREDAEQREFFFDRRIRSIVNSKNGQYLLITFHGDYPPVMYPISATPGGRPLLLNLHTEERVEKSGISWISYLGNNGFGIAFNGDSIYFYDNNLNLLSKRYDYRVDYLHPPSSFSADGTLFLTWVTESSDEVTSSILRAFDNFGNILWDYREPIGGRPKVADNGKHALLIGSESVSCVDGLNGTLLWTQDIENLDVTPPPVASRDGLAAIFRTDFSPAEVRENPDRDRYLCNVVIDSEGNPCINEASFNSRIIAFGSPNSVNSTGTALWNLLIEVGGDVHIGDSQVSLFSNKGNLLYSRWETDEGIRLRGHWRNTFDLIPSAIDSSGLRFITAFDSAIHIITLVRTGAGVE